MNNVMNSGMPANAVDDFDVTLLRMDFPILDHKVGGKSLIYFDNAATTQKPESVIKAMDDYYRCMNANVHRAAHTLSAQATDAFERARRHVAAFINSPFVEEVIWVRGTTEAINLVAATWGRTNIQAGDRILLTELEHHSNIVPWQLLAKEKGAEIIVLPVTDAGELDLTNLDLLLDQRVKLVALAHASNALGTRNPLEQIIEKAHSVGAKVLIDGAQAVAHWDIDVQSLNCDFYAFSGHKMYGPTGIGVLWGRRELLEKMPPYQSGGEMIKRVSFSDTSFNDLPYKFEAGTPNIAGAIGMGAAIKYLGKIDRKAMSQYEAELLEYAVRKVADIPGINRVGTAKDSASIFSFTLEGVHPSDVGTILNQQGIAVRDGHHCAQPLMDRLNIPGTIRASFAFYNTFDEIDQFVEGLVKARNLLCQRPS